MSDDDIRDALRRYATAAPDTDPRGALPGTLARRARRQRVAVASVACLAALVAGTGVAVLTSTPAGSDRLIAAADPTTEPPATEEPEPEPPPTAEPSPAVTKTAHPVPGGTPSPSTPPTTAPPPGPVPGLTVGLSLEPAGPETATYATLKVGANDGDGHPSVSAIRWGDGTEEPMPVRPAVSCALPPPGPREPEPTAWTASYEHAWRHDGTYTIEVVVRSGYECDYSAREDVVERLTVEVAAGVIRSNGPARTRARDVEALRPDGAGERTVRLLGFLADRDGYVTGATVDWGDGTTTEVTNDRACDDGDGQHYPVHGDFAVEADHEYAETGDYDVVVTWSSAGCDFMDAQQGRWSGSVTVPVPPPDEAG